MMKVFSTIIKVGLTVTVLASCAIRAEAQLDPFAAQYFSNQYLGSPALAGADGGTRINLGYRQLWNRIPGGPEQQYLTAEHGFNRVGIGLNLGREKTGLHGRVRAVGTYAYHLPLNDVSRLSFGVSLGFMNQRLEPGIDGDLTDEQISKYNSRGTHIDGDFGAALTTRGLNLQVALPNLKNLWGNDEDVRIADIPTFYAAASYKLAMTPGNEGMMLEPKAAFRGVKGFHNIWDLGAQFTLANSQIMVMGMYHSTQTSTFGIGMDYKRKYLINAMYTTQSSAMNGYTNGNFEVSVRTAF